MINLFIYITHHRVPPPPSPPNVMNIKSLHGQAIITQTTTAAGAEIQSPCEVVWREEEEERWVAVVKAFGGRVDVWWWSLEDGIKT